MTYSYVTTQKGLQTTFVLMKHYTRTLPVNILLLVFVSLSVQLVYPTRKVYHTKILFASLTSTSWSSCCFIYHHYYTRTTTLQLYCQVTNARETCHGARSARSHIHINDNMNSGFNQRKRKLFFLISFKYEKQNQHPAER